MEEEAKAIIEKFVDADMSAEEIGELLVHNGIPEGMALSVATDLRGEK